MSPSNNAVGLSTFALLAWLAQPSSARAESFTTLYRFTNQTDGEQPDSLAVKNGVLYGTTAGSIALGHFDCSAPDCGTVFSFNPATSQLTTLHTFNEDKNGYFPYGLVADRAGFTGLTSYGGQNDLGLFFTFDPTTGMLTTRASLTSVDNEASPPVLYKSKLYGTSPNGTPNGNPPYSGVVYSLKPAGGKTSVLYAFQGQANSNADGWYPVETPAIANGILYGTTNLGGTNQLGTIFQLDIASGKETVLYSFTDGKDGKQPAGPVIYDRGVLYGISVFGASSRCTGGCGAVWKFDLAKSSLTVLLDFVGPDGDGPNSIALMRTKLYVTCGYGGMQSAGNVDGAGTLVTIDTATGKHTLLHSFAGTGDGAQPGSLIASGGTLYGVTSSDTQTDNNGTIFAVSP